MAASPIDHSSLQQKMEDQIKCPICFEIFREPKVLSCYHVFCLTCLQATASSQRASPGGVLSCPHCRKRVEIPREGLSNLKSAFHINNLIDIYNMMINKPDKVSECQSAAVSECSNCPGSKADYFCAECNAFLCEDCRVIHGKWPKFSKHVVSLLSGDRSPTCELFCCHHTSHRLTHYCKQCKVQACSECLQGSDHCSHIHQVVSITEALHQSKDTILAALEPVRRQLGTVEAVIERIKAKKRHIREQASNVKACVNNDIHAFFQEIEQRQGKLKETVEREEEGKIVALTSQEEKAEVARVQLSDYLEGITGCLKKGNSLQVIKMQQTVEDKVKAITEEFSHLPLSPVEEANLCYFGNKEVVAALASVGTVYSGSTKAEHLCVTVGGLHWATACTETSVRVKCLESGKQSSWYGNIDVKLSSIDDCNLLVVTRRDVCESERQVILHYIPIAKGKKKLHVTMFGKEVSNSPLDLIVMAPFQFTGTVAGCVSELKRPWGIAMTPSGQLVVVDNQGWSGIHIYDANGATVSTFARSAPSQNTPALLLHEEWCKEPRGVAITKDGNILLVDGKRHRLQCFSPNGTLHSIVGAHGKQQLQFNDPIGVTVAPSGDVLVCDRRNHRIQVLTPNLDFVRQIGRLGVDDTEPSGLYLPWDVACDSDGRVYVADCGHCCVKVFTSNGEYVKKMGTQGSGRGQFKHLSSICIDSNDYLYALDMERACVTIFNPRGEFKMQFGTPGELEGQFTKPRGIAVDDKGHVYVSDGEPPALGMWTCGRVQVFE